MSQCSRTKMNCCFRGVMVAVLSAIACGAAAQKYPDKPVRLVVGFPPGGAADILGRIAAAQLTASLGEQVVEFRNMVITPVAAYLSPLHSVVAGEDQEVHLTLREAHDGALISIDGQEDLPMAIGDRVEVRALPEPLRMIEPAGSTPFYDLLRTKASLLPY